MSVAARSTSAPPALVALGEVMLRLDPGEGRVRTTRQFRVWEGGGEYNVARGLRRCFGHRTSIVTALVDNEVGRLIEDLMLAGGVDTSLLRWARDDGMGHAARNGLNFTERGFGIRGAVGVSDRGHTAVSQLRPGDVDWDGVFSTGVRWFHSGGVFAGLSDSTPAVLEEAMTAARRHGVTVSYDLNYRPSLWARRGGVATCREVNARLAPLVDVMIGNEEDFTACLGFEVAGTDEHFSSVPREGYAAMMEEVAAALPGLSAVATTLRTVVSASRNDWGALAWSPATGVLESTHRTDLDVLDRVGGGDSFASGLIHGLLSGHDLQTSLEYGAAHGALAMTTPGDTSMATVDEVERLMSGTGARVRR